MNQLLERRPIRATAVREDVRPRTLTGWDYAGMVAGILLTVAVTVVNSRGRIFWEDEMLGWLLLHDPSWRHMIQAWNLGADGGGFSFYLLGRGWFRLFGASAISFRMFSSTCFSIGFAVAWVALRRFYPRWIVALALFNTWFFSPPLLAHFIEGRFYGLLVMSTALAMWLVLRLEEQWSAVPARLYLAAFLVHGLLTTSHVLGVVYSAFFLGATVVLDRLARRWRPGLYAAAAASWLLLIPERTSILAAARVGKPHFWTKAPNFWDVVGAYSGFSREIFFALVLLVVLAAVSLWSRRGGVTGAVRRGFRTRRPMYVAGLALLCMPLLLLLEGTVGTWLFTDRYLQPLVIGVAFVTAELLCLSTRRELLPRVKQRWPVLLRLTQAGAIALFAALLLFWDFHHVRLLTPEPPDYTETLTAHLPKDIPVVCEDAFTFTGVIGKQYRSGVHYVYLLDWAQATSPAAPRMEVTQFHLMENWKKAGYFPDAIQDFGTFVREHSRFLVVHAGPIHEDPNVKPEIGNPIVQRMAAMPGYEVRRYFVLDRTNRDFARDTVWMVCRGGCGA